MPKHQLIQRVNQAGRPYDVLVALEESTGDFQKTTWEDEEEKALKPGDVVVLKSYEELEKQCCKVLSADNEVTCFFKSTEQRKVVVSEVKRFLGRSTVIKEVESQDDSGILGRILGSVFEKGEELLITIDEHYRIPLWAVQEHGDPEVREHD